MKRAFPNNTMLVFVKRPKKDLIRAIVERDVSADDKTNRIISLSDEFKNEILCDVTVDNSGNIDEAFRQLVACVNR